MRFRSLRIPRTARFMTVAAIAVGTIAASVLQAGASVSDQSPSVGAVIIQSPAHLVARGAAVTVRSTVVCEPNTFAFLSVRVTENVSGNI